MKGGNSARYGKKTILQYNPDAFGAVKEAFKATCLVRRVKCSKERKEYNEELAKKYTGKEKTHHESKAQNWDKKAEEPACWYGQISKAEGGLSSQITRHHERMRGKDCLSLL